MVLFCGVSALSFKPVHQQTKWYCCRQHNRPKFEHRNPPKFSCHRKYKTNPNTEKTSTANHQANYLCIHINYVILVIIAHNKHHRAMSRAKQESNFSCLLYPTRAKQKHRQAPESWNIIIQFCGIISTHHQPNYYCHNYGYNYQWPLYCGMHLKHYS